MDENINNEVVVDNENNDNLEENTSSAKENVALDETKEEESKEEAKEEKSGDSFDWVRLIVFAFVFVFIIMSFFIRIGRVDGSSMYPTFQEAQPVLISNLFYTPKTGDIVVVQQSNLETRAIDYPIVKRVIATSNQTVEIDFDNWTVKVDGVLLEEDYVNRIAGSMKRLDMKENTFTVPEGYIFIMGDNRNGSTDSRYSKIGYIRESEIIGKAVLRIIPFTIF